MTKTIFERTFPARPTIDTAVTITPVTSSPFTAINGQVRGRIRTSIRAS